MYFCIVTAGCDLFPPIGAAACENIAVDYQFYLEKLGHKVDIIHSYNPNEIINQINNTNYDWVHLHFDDWHYLSPYINKPHCATAHYAYLKDPAKWQPGYQNKFIQSLKCPFLLNLSNNIDMIYKKFGYNGYSKVLRNGVAFDQYKFNPIPEKQCICIGRIEKRKGQSLLTKLSLSNNIDFVGPIIDMEFKENTRCKYQGIWNREQLYNKLSDYRTLILLSDGEAHPLVIPEALACGLSIVTTKTASDNLDLNSPYVSIINNEFEILPKILANSVENNNQYRYNIREYAKNYFDWYVILKEYIALIQEYNIWEKSRS